MCQELKEGDFFTQPLIIVTILILTHLDDSQAYYFTRNRLMPCHRRDDQYSVYNIQLLRQLCALLPQGYYNCKRVGRMKGRCNCKHTPFNSWSAFPQLLVLMFGSTCCLYKYYVVDGEVIDRTTSDWCEGTRHDYAPRWRLRGHVHSSASTRESWQ